MLRRHFFKRMAQVTVGLSCGILLGKTIKPVYSKYIPKASDGLVGIWKPKRKEFLILSSEQMEDIKLTANWNFLDRLDDIDFIKT